MLFGKNSDRQRNEAQTVEYLSGGDHPPGAQLRCTHIVIDQAARTHATLLCRPFWIWGAEMGANEFGVVIGNEAVRARSPAPQEKALSGMDLVRLGLERATTAGEAVEVMTRALARYGQGGDCGYLRPSYYHNSFIITDAHEAFVLETIDREWLLERARGVRTISNRYSIEQQADRISAGLPSLLHSYGWRESAVSNYAELIADPVTAHIGNARARQACSAGLLEALDGRVTVAAMIGTLRNHGTGAGSIAPWRPECILEGTLCMHAGDEDHPAQTVGSMVSEIHSGNAVHWVTGTAAPCISIFKPVLMDAPLPAHGPSPTGQFDARTLWWRHERLHRTVVRRDFGRFVEDIRAQRDSLEAEFRNRVHRVVGSDDSQERCRVIAQCWQDAAEMEAQWHLRMRHTSAAEYDSHAAVVAGWQQMNVLAAMDLE